MLMVVCLHTILSFTLREDFFATKAWFILEPIVAFSKIGVLLFFMISGYLVINKNRSIVDNWKITKKRILVPLCFFSILNFGYELYKFSLMGKSQSLFWKEQLSNINNFPNSPLWFLVVLLFLYLLNPVWQTLFTKERDSSLALYVTKMSLSFSLLVTIIKFFSHDHTVFFNSFTLWIGYVFFYLYGGLVRNNWVSFNKVRINLAMITIGLLSILVGDFYTLFRNAHSLGFIWSGYFFEYLSIPIIMLAVGTFNLFVSNDFSWTNKKLSHNIINVIEMFAGLSYGVYLIHPFVASIFTDILGFDFDKLSMNVYLFNFINYFLVLGISVLVSFLIVKTPGLRLTIGGADFLEKNSKRQDG